MVGCEDVESIYHLAIDAAENILDFDICGIDVVEGSTSCRRRFRRTWSPRTPSASQGRGRRRGDVPGEQTNHRGGRRRLRRRRPCEPRLPVYPERPHRGRRRVPGGLRTPGRVLGAGRGTRRTADGPRRRDPQARPLGGGAPGERGKYRTLVEQSHDAVVIFRDGSYEFVNNRATELFGRDEAALTNADGWVLVHPDDRADLRAINEELVAEVGRQRTFEARIRRPSGDVRYCEFSVTSIDYDGDVASLASIRDITERKEHERELERQNERLDEFASVVSHDLRSPINVAKGSVDLTQQTGDSEHLDRAADALDRMEALVEDILDLARQGQLVDETEPVDLADLGAEAWESVDAPEAALVTEVDATVAADAGRLRELFENLFRNAVEHGGADVTVTLTDCEGGFAVSDDGPGIPDGAHDAVFERGTRPSRTGRGSDSPSCRTSRRPTTGPSRRCRPTGRERASRSPASRTSSDGPGYDSSRDFAMSASPSFGGSNAS